MISIDRKVSRDILKVTRDYNQKVLFDTSLGGYSIWRMHNTGKIEQTSSVPASEVPGALQRLADRGMIEKVQGIMGGGMIFRIRPELLHARAFWWDRFTKKFWSGYVLGVITALTANLLTGPALSVLSKAFQWLSNLK